jgi:hypothetical protein
MEKDVAGFSEMLIPIYQNKWNHPATGLLKP